MQIENQTSQPIQSFIQNQLKKYQTHADFVAFKYVHENTKDFVVRNAKPDELREFDDQGVLIEIMINGHLGYGATSALTNEGIQQAFAKALQMTKQASQKPVYRFTPQVRPLAQGKYRSQRQENLDRLSLAEIYDFLKKTSQALKTHDHIISTTADALLINCQQYYISTNGSEFEQNYDIVINAMEAVASHAGETQSRSLHGGRGNCLQVGAEYFRASGALENSLKNANLIAQQALELLKAENCPSETCDLILSPDQMLLQIHESIGHPLELDRILGDERNFAGWSFVQPTDFGQLQYGSKLMNVVFDPTPSQELASYAFDEAGLRAEKKYLIHNGILQAGLGSLESQQRSSLQGVANSRASSWNRAPIDRMANINLEGGNLSLDEMISQVERGVLMNSNRSWSIDDYRRKFQFGCEYAHLIENGKLTKVLKNPNYRGVTVPFWNSLAGLTQPNSVEIYGSPYCGKGEPSQVIRVGHSSPYALFKNIEVFGGG